MVAKKNYTEAEMIDSFGLTRLKYQTTVAMTEWLNVSNAILDAHQQFFFEEILNEAQISIEGWNEEELKMQFISPLFLITGLKNTQQYRIFTNAYLQQLLKINRFL